MSSMQVLEDYEVDLVQWFIDKIMQRTAEKVDKEIAEKEKARNYEMGYDTKDSIRHDEVRKTLNKLLDLVLPKEEIEEY